MPKIVDHDARRLTIAAAACQTIATLGLEGATLSTVAHAAGVTSGAIQHYFDDKDGVLSAALRHAYDDQLQRMAKRAARRPYALLDVLGEALPLTVHSRRTMRVWLAFWGRAIGDPGTAAAQRVIHDHWSERVSEELHRAVAAGALPAALPVADETEGLIAQIRGICIRALLDPGAWRPARQLALLNDYLQRLPAQAIATGRPAGNST